MTEIITSPLQSVAEDTVGPDIKRMVYETQRFVQTDINVIKYTFRQIHSIKGTTSHPVIAQIAMIQRHEKFRVDPRFPLFQMMQQTKRYKAIFAGQPYLPIFS